MPFQLHVLLHKVLIAKLVGTSGERVFKVYFYFLFAWLRIANDENDFWHEYKSDPDEHREQHLNLAKNIGNKKSNKSSCYDMFKFIVPKPTKSPNSKSE